MMKIVALIAAIILPLWNIPLIVRVIRRRSSEDLSVPWAVGVWICFVLMFPEGLKSTDVVWRTFSIANLTLFTMVVAVVLLYRKKR